MKKLKSVTKVLLIVLMSPVLAFIALLTLPAICAMWLADWAFNDIDPIRLIIVGMSTEVVWIALLTAIADYLQV